MGFKVQIEADYRSEILQNIHPHGKPSGGKAILAFLTGLSGYTTPFEEPNLMYVDKWYQNAEVITKQSFFPICHPILDCMWGDGGDATEYEIYDYHFYLQRHQLTATNFSEADFQEWIRLDRKRWESISDVIKGVQLLLKMFSNHQVEALEGFYAPTDTIPDFEALEHNLKLLDSRGNTTVRLNFR